MEKFLELSPADRQQAFDQAGLARGWPAESVEKDFWVTLTLRELYALPELGRSLTFKGGTSLSKAWGLIDRFSEDLDLTLDRDTLGFGGADAPEAAASRKAQGRRLDGLKDACRRAVHESIAPALEARLDAVVPKGEAWDLSPDPDDGDAQTLSFNYPGPRRAMGSGYLPPRVKLEFGARSDPWPVEPREVRSIVAEVYPDLVVTATCQVQALRPERTFWEKVLLLQEETYRPAAKPRRPRMARHYYDVWRLIEAGVGENAAKDLALFERVAQHRQIYFNQTWVDYGNHRKGAIQMLPTGTALAEWEADYAAMRPVMFTTEPPPFSVLLERIERFQADFNAA